MYESSLYGRPPSVVAEWDDEQCYIDYSCGGKTMQDYVDQPIVLENAHTWADPVDVPMTDLLARPTWKDSTLVPLSEASILFDRWRRPLHPRRLVPGRWGRQVLGKWGPNHAADPIVTADPVVPGDPYRVLLITRGDVNMRALPGGMVDPGETFTRTLKREIVEEAAEDSSLLQEALDKGRIVYTGIVDDPRETNNAWIETAAVHAHLSADEATKIVLRPSLDGETISSAWVDVTDHTLSTLYANHGYMISLAMEAAKLPIASTASWFPGPCTTYILFVFVILSCVAAALLHPTVGVEVYRTSMCTHDYFIPTILSPLDELL